MDCLRDIDDAERRIASNRKSAQTGSKQSAAIADATLPALERKLLALRQELPTLPADRPREFSYHSFKFNYANHFPIDMPDLPIPEFLRRMK